MADKSSYSEFMCLKLSSCEFVAESSRKIFSWPSEVQKSGDEVMCVSSCEREDSADRSKAVPQIQNK